MPIGRVSIASPQICPVSVLLFRQFLPATQVSGAALALWFTTRVTVNNLVAFTNWTLASDLLLWRFRGVCCATQERCLQLTACCRSDLDAVALTKGQSERHLNVLHHHPA